MIDCIIDISHHNANVALAKAQAAGILAVIHKATQGAAMVDAKYAQRMAAAKAYGLLWGAYHFGAGGDAEAQAQLFLGNAQLASDDLAVLDFEANPSGETMSVAEAETFVLEIATARGRLPVLYSGQSFLRAAIAKQPSEILAKCPLWLARYGGNAPVSPGNYPAWSLWQYTDGVFGDEPHVTPGVGACDRNRFDGDEAALRIFWVGKTSIA